ncbi:molybdopterin-binding domain-containing protein [Bacillus salinus]|uniref:hypothetical protein n=1 Tax=Bacillus sp. HMF5848 TaxID=2495421 RepID=UPI0021ADBF76|nr:hypothetical protein [Bacillus sp. HMF5848]
MQKKSRQPKPVIWNSSFAPARTYRGQQFCQAFLTVGWMTGNVGKPGAGVWTMGYASNQSYGGKTLVRGGGSGLPSAVNPLFPDATYGAYDGYRWANPTNTEAHGMAYCETYDAILNNEYTATAGRGKIPCDIRMIWLVRDGSGYNFLNQSSDINKGVKAFVRLMLSLQMILLFLRFQNTPILFYQQRPNGKKKEQLGAVTQKRCSL